MATLYFVVEGKRTEPALYGAWIPLLLPEYRRVRRIEDAAENTFFIVAGHGYPSYNERILAALEDIVGSDGGFTHLIVCVDSEERSIDERHEELQAVVHEKACPAPIQFIIANCCIETWLLGNMKFVRRNPQSAELRRLLGLYDVTERDPERMPSLDSTFSTRARFHCHYLQHAFKERDLAFSKRRPGHAASKGYFEQLCRRTESRTDGEPDLASFAKLLNLPNWLLETTSHPDANPS
ncbi:MAG: hypothetical protein KC468_03625 [Myxococcales bacterium]|nr:hypothetical protein [Myxococcales bacterium]